MDDQEFVISETSESQPPIKGFSIKVVDDTFLIQFVDELASELVSLDITQDDIGHMLIMLDSEQIQMLQFPGLADRFDLNKVKIRYSSIKDIFYIANANTSHHDYSVEVEQFDEKIMIDFDVNDQIIGFAILGASTMINPDFLNELPDHVVWKFYDLTYIFVDTVNATNNTNNNINITNVVGTINIYVIYVIDTIDTI
eukprot:TRINITY_DN2770_c0_g1_i2.p1 TRINITY_DN2770_c0_g1~~TRINITY_DN2770_c0_g1_i2.p1  ORF type:complete len:198 (+),score=42.82 TRINITY_DN2770_c0_g1_i2:11-604(+)